MFSIQAKFHPLIIFKRKKKAFICNIEAITLNYVKKKISKFFKLIVSIKNLFLV